MRLDIFELKKYGLIGIKEDSGKHLILFSRSSETILFEIREDIIYKQVFSDGISNGLKRFENTKDLNNLLIKEVMI